MTEQLDAKHGEPKDEAPKQLAMEIDLEEGLAFIEGELAPALRASAEDPDASTWALLRWLMEAVELLPEEADERLARLNVYLPTSGQVWLPVSSLFLGADWVTVEEAEFSNGLGREHLLAGCWTCSRSFPGSVEAALRVFRRLGLSAAPRLHSVAVGRPIWGRSNTNKGGFYDCAAAPVRPIPPAAWERWVDRACPGGGAVRGTTCAPSELMWVSGLGEALIADKVAAWIVSRPADFEAARRQHHFNGWSTEQPWVTALRGLDASVVPTERRGLACGALRRPSALLRDLLEDAPENALLPLVDPNVPAWLLGVLAIPTLKNARAERIAAVLVELARSPWALADPMAERAVQRLWRALAGCSWGSVSEAVASMSEQPVPAWRRGQLEAVNFHEADEIYIDDAPDATRVLAPRRSAITLELGEHQGRCSSLTSALREALGPERVLTASELQLPEAWAAGDEPRSLQESLVEALRAETWWDEEVGALLESPPDGALGRDARWSIERAMLKVVQAPGDESIWRSEEDTLYVTRGLMEAPFALLPRCWVVMGEPWRTRWRRWATAALLGGAARRAVIWGEGEE